MKKTAVTYALFFSLNVSAYPAYVASECGWLNRKAITFDKLGENSGEKMFSTVMELKKKYSGGPSRRDPNLYTKERISSALGKNYNVHSPNCFQIGPLDWLCYNTTNKDMIETTYYGWFDPQDYWSGIDTYHYWRRISLRQPGVGYNSMRSIKNTTSCCLTKLCEHDWDETGMDENQKV